ncbi:hypothetical protein RJO15_20390 [Herbaspirillum huttiense F1]|uniref:hypothetical protein n=1 Tax=Herbaspirillum TaxID=963 RepID=UPI001AE1CDDE|nr:MULTISPECIES: hypothetical protein [Herbaspirillum]MBP1313380.1 hypothetical protein [Herbaspirillum sp. 1130]MDR6738621.1 hypothetical protein [Herbaspirillum sp. 1173]MDT0358159.1 hypothetical protein [Herbaspirillum huttiense F1]
MNPIWTAVIPIITAIAAGTATLVGIRWGAGLTRKREQEREDAQRQQDATYLAIIVSTHLERFTNSCVDVMYDDGTAYGQPADAKTGYHEVTTTTPTIDPMEFDVNWKALPGALMYEILSLPYKQELLKRHLGAVGEHDMPPDFADFFWERQYGYACLARDVADLASRLRMNAGLPVLPHSLGKWDRAQGIDERITKLEHIRDSQPRPVMPFFPEG